MVATIHFLIILLLLATILGLFYYALSRKFVTQHDTAPILSTSVNNILYEIRWQQLWYSGKRRPVSKKSKRL